MSDEERGEALRARLRQLAIVEPEALLSGAEHPAELAAAYADDLADALAVARAAAGELLAEASRGPDPLAILDAPFEVRAREGGPEAARQTVERLRRRAEACRRLAALDEAAAELVPPLFRADRRRTQES